MFTSTFPPSPPNFMNLVSTELTKIRKHPLHQIKHRTFLKLKRQPGILKNIYINLLKKIIFHTQFRDFRVFRNFYKSMSLLPILIAKYKIPGKISTFIPVLEIMNTNFLKNSFSKHTFALTFWKFYAKYVAFDKDSE